MRQIVGQLAIFVVEGIVVAQRAPVGYPEQTQGDVVRHRSGRPLIHRCSRAGHQDVDRLRRVRSHLSVVRDLGGSVMQVRLKRNGVGVSGKHGQIVQHNLMLQVRQGAGLRNRIHPQTGARASGKSAESESGSKPWTEGRSEHCCC